MPHVPIGPPPESCARPRSSEARVAGTFSGWSPPCTQSNQSPEHVRSFRYKAFISYSTAADGRLAPALQTGLQQFAKPWYRLRAMRVFRDKTGLTLTPKLWGSIESALREAEYFILLASPAAAASKWVQQEVDWWLKYRSVSHLLIIWTDGNIAWDDTGGDFDWKQTDALPPALADDFSSEPLHLDLRWAKNVSDLSLRRPRFAEAVARIAATLKGRSLDEIIGEDVIQHQKTLQWLRFAAFVLVATTAGASLAALLAVQARNMSLRMVRQTQAAETLQTNEALSRRLAFTSSQVAGSDPALATLLAVEAVRLQPTAEATSALRHSLASSLQPVATLPLHTNKVCYAAFSPDGTQILTWGDSVLHLYEASTRRLLRDFQGHSGTIDQAMFDKTGTYICSAGGDEVRLWDVATSNCRLTMKHEGVNAALLSPNAKSIISLAMGREALLWNATTGTSIAELPYGPNLIFFDQIRDAAFSLDSSQIAVCLRTGPELLDAVSGKTLREFKADTGSVRSLCFTADDAWIVTATEDGSIHRWSRSSDTHTTFLKHSLALQYVRPTPDGKYLLGRDAANSVLVWEMATGRQVAAIQPRPEPMLPSFFAVDPSGKCLAVGVFDRGSIDIWEPATGLRIAELPARDAEARTISFSPDGTRVIVGAFDTPARIYECDACGSLETLLELAKKRVQRELTPAERAEYLKTD